MFSNTERVTSNLYSTSALSMIALIFLLRALMNVLLSERWWMCSYLSLFPPPPSPVSLPISSPFLLFFLILHPPPPPFYGIPDAPSIYTSMYMYMYIYTYICIFTYTPRIYVYLHIRPLPSLPRHRCCWELHVKDFVAGVGSDLQVTSPSSSPLP